MALLVIVCRVTYADVLPCKGAGTVNLFASRVHALSADFCYYYNWLQRALELVHRCHVESPDWVVQLLVVILWHHRLLGREFLSVQPFLPPRPLLVCHSQHPFSFASHATHYTHGPLGLGRPSVWDVWYSKKLQ